MKTESVVIGAIGLFYLLSKGSGDPGAMEVGASAMDTPIPTAPGTPPATTPAQPISPSIPGGRGVTHRPASPEIGGGLPSPGESPTTGATTPSFGVNGIFEQPGYGVVVTADGRVYYDYLRHHGWEIAVETINGLPLRVHVHWPSSGRQAPNIFIKRGEYRANFNQPAVSVNSSATYRPLKVEPPRGSEFLGELIQPNSIYEGVIWYPDMSSAKIRYVYSGARWSLRDGQYFIADRPVPKKEWDAYHRGSIYGLTKFRVGRLVADPEAERLIGKTDSLGRPYNDYVAYYNANPWVLDALRANPCGPAGQALAVILAEGFSGLMVEHRGTVTPTPKPEMTAMLNWWMTHLTAQDLARLPQPEILPTSGKPSSRGSGRPAYRCPLTGRLVG